jgi:hypothetical protein
MRRVLTSTLTLWVVVGLFFAGGLVRSQQVSDNAKSAAQSAKRAAARASAVQAQQQDTIDRLGALVRIECVRSKNGALLRNLLITAATEPIAAPAPGSTPGLLKTVRDRNVQLVKSRERMRSVGRAIPQVAC